MVSPYEFEVILSRREERKCPMEPTWANQRGYIMKPAFPSAIAGGLGKGRIGALTPVRPVSLAGYFIASNEIIIAHLF